MKIQVKTQNETVVFKLNDSKAAKDLYEQLPFNAKIENSSSNEKVFYPPKKLSASAPQATAKKGTLCYFASWGEVVMFYKSFGGASGLFELGEVISGEENIRKLTGSATISAL